MAEITIMADENITADVGSDENIIAETASAESIDAVLAVFDGGNGSAGGGANYGTIEYMGG